MLFTSVERAPGHQRVVGGVLKSVREPVISIVGERAGAVLSCDWLFTYAGLVPGDYALTEGFSVRIPQRFTGREAVCLRGVTLEVNSG